VRALAHAEQCVTGVRQVRAGGCFCVEPAQGAGGAFARVGCAQSCEVGQRKGREAHLEGWDAHNKRDLNKRGLGKGGETGRPSAGVDGRGEGGAACPEVAGGKGARRSARSVAPCHPVCGQVKHHNARRGERRRAWPEGVEVRARARAQTPALHKASCLAAAARCARWQARMGQQRAQGSVIGWADAAANERGRARALVVSPQAVRVAEALAGRSARCQRR
jgi:hypothetical protein